MENRILKYIITNNNELVLTKLKQIENVLKDTIRKKYNCEFLDIVYERIIELYPSEYLTNLEVWLIVGLDILNLELIKYTACNCAYKLQVVESLIKSGNLTKDEGKYSINNKLDLLLLNSKNIQEIIKNI